MPPLKLLVFDLDGTLIDSRLDLCHSVNATLVYFGKSPLPEAVIASYIGDGAGMLIRRALGDPEGSVHDQEYIADAVAFFLDYYHVHKLDYTTLYPGVLGSLEAIRRECPALLMAVLTNKPVRPSRDICAHFGMDRFFFQNYGGNSFHTKKPDPLGLQTLIAEAGQILGTAVAQAETPHDRRLRRRHTHRAQHRHLVARLHLRSCSGDADICHSRPPLPQC